MSVFKVRHSHSCTWIAGLFCHVRVFIPFSHFDCFLSVFPGILSSPLFRVIPFPFMSPIKTVAFSSNLSVYSISFSLWSCGITAINESQIAPLCNPYFFMGLPILFPSPFPFLCKVFGFATSDHNISLPISRIGRTFFLRVFQKYCRLVNWYESQLLWSFWRYPVIRWDFMFLFYCDLFFVLIQHRRRKKKEDVSKSIKANWMENVIFRFWVCYYMFDQWSQVACLDNLL